MAFPDDVTLALNDNSSPITYSIINMGDGLSVRRSSGRTLAEPALLTISHKKDSKNTYRRMVRIDHTSHDVEVGSKTVSAHTVLTIPEIGVTKTDVSDVLERLMSFFAQEGYLEKLIIGEP